MWSDKLTQIGIFQRIPFVIRPGMDSSLFTSSNLMKYGGGIDLTRGYYPQAMHGIAAVSNRKFQNLNFF